MKKLHFYLDEFLELKVKETPLKSCIEKKTYLDAYAEIAKKSNTKKGISLCMYNPYQDNPNDKYVLSSFPSATTYTKEMYRLSNNTIYCLTFCNTLVGLDQQYARGDYRNIDEHLKKILSPIIDKVTVASLFIASVTYSNSIRDHISSVFRSVSELVETFLPDKREYKKMKFLLDNPDRIFNEKVMNKPTIRDKPDFNKEVYEKLTNDMCFMTKYKNNTKLNTFLSQHYNFDNPSIYYLKLVLELDENNHQSTQYASSSLNNQWGRIKRIVGGVNYNYYSREIEEIRSLYTRPEEKKEIDFEMNKICMQVNIMEYIKLKEKFPELLGRFSFA